MMSVNYLKKTIRALFIVPVLLSHIAFADEPENLIAYQQAYTLQHADVSRIKYKRLQFAVHNNTLIYAQYLNTGNDDTLRFYKKDLLSGKEEIHKVFIENFHEQYDPRRIYNSIDFDLRYVCILFDRFLILLESKNEGKEYRLHSFTDFKKIGYKFDKLRLYDGKVTLYTNYNHPKKNYKTCIAVFDIAKEKLIKEIRPKFNLIELTHIGPHNYIDACNDGRIIFSQGQNADVKIYDLSLGCVDSFSLHPNGWNKLPKKAFDSLLNIESVISPTWVSWVDQYSRVFYAYLLNKNKALIGYSLNADKYEYVITEKRNNQWMVMRTDSFSVNDWTTKENIEKNAWFLYRMTWSQNLFFDNDEVYMLQLMSDKFPWEMPASDLKKYEENYYEDHDPLVYIIKAEVK